MSEPDAPDSPGVPPPAPPALSPTAWLRHHLPAIVLLGAVILGIFWPVCPPTRWTHHIHWGDAFPNAYLVNWGQNILPQTPWKFFAMPLFHPQENSGAFTDAFPLLCLLSSPLRLLGNPLVSYNGAMATAIFLLGLSAYLFVFWLTRHRRASIFAGVIFACNGDVLWHVVGHPGIISAFCIPGAIGFYLAYRLRGGRAAAVACAVCVVGSFFCSFYLGIIGLMGVGILWVVDVVSARFRLRWREAWLAGSILVVLALAFMYSGPFRDVSSRFGNTRGVHDAVVHSADVVEYMVPPHLKDRGQTWLGEQMGKWVSWSTRAENAQFFGYLAWLLALWALGGAVWRGVRRRAGAEDRLLLKLGLLGFVALILSFGPYLWIGPKLTGIPLPFRAIYEYVPPLRFLRAPARFAVLVGLGVAAGAGLLLARARWFNPRPLLGRLAIFAVGLGILVFEYRPTAVTPLRKYNFEAFRVLRNFPELDTVAAIPLNESAMLVDSTSHFPRTPSGYVGGVTNYHYRVLENLVNDFPSTRSLAVLAALEVDAVAVYGEARRKQADTVSVLERLAPWSGGGLYRLSFPEGVALEQARELVKSIPERPRVERREDFPPLTPQTRILTTPGSAASFSLDYTYREIYKPFIFPGNKLPMREVGRIYVKMAARDVGVDYSMSKIYWVTEEDPAPDEAKSCAAFFLGDGSMQVVEFDLTRIAAWRKGGTLAKLRFDFVAKPYPGQRVRVEEVRITPN